MINPIASANQSATSTRMKKTFIILCILLCIISYILYSRQTVNWTFLPTIISSSLSVSQISNNSLSNKIITKTAKPNRIKKPLLPPSQNRRFAIFGCSIHASIHAYTFYTPITALSWNRVGYEAIVVFVGDFKKPNVLTKRLNLSRNYLKSVGAHIVDFQCNESYSIKLSQVVRVFAGFLPDDIVEDEDNILTGDSDLMPLRISEYTPTSGTDGFVFNAHCCGTFQRRGKNYKMYPMGHIFLQKKTWRAMVMESQQRAELLAKADNRTQELLSADAPLSFETITLYGRLEFKDVYDQRMDKGDAAWYMDQILCSMLIHDYKQKHQNFSLSERGRGERLDRVYGMGYWDRPNYNQFGDAHLKHDEILEAGNWKIFTKLLKSLFNDTMVTLFNDYYKQYMVVGKLP
ncbi:unnamed protein product [Adineta steineri]|uniref:Uncharacterized protein n=1 Tax=Adineta steineri TaxID=433720 RepID=A0A814LKL8_9BILA|nr:unnamed protein product [Adineta steineri]